MTLEDILRRYIDYGVVVYGGDRVFLDTIARTNKIVTWISLNGETYPTTDTIPDRLITIIVTTTGYIDGMRVETKIDSYLQSSHAIICHGYPEFNVEGLDVMKEVYTGGCLISSMRGEVHRLKNVSSLLLDPIPIPIPFSYNSSMDRLLPYIHIYTRLEEIKDREGTLRIPTREDLPTSIDTAHTMSTIYSTSSYVDKERKLLLAAIDLLIRAPPQSILLYYGDLYIRWVPQLLDLFLSRDIEIHLWGKDQGMSIPTSDNVKVRPTNLGTDTPNINLYINTYGSTPNIVVLADSDNDDLISLNPIAAYLPYRENMKVPGTVTITPYSTLGRANLLYTRSNKSIPFTRQTNINYFHHVDRMDSYNIGRIISDELGVRDIDRYIIMPDVGLCTCYDCASEVSIMCKYMRIMDIPFDIDTLHGLIKYNGPSLYSISRPISRPSDRKDIIIPVDQIDKILDLDIYMYNNIGIGVTNTNIPTPYIEDDIPPMERMRRILGGSRYPLVINFHRDFTRNYNPDTDKGRLGEKRYKKFLQDVSLNRSNLDTWGVLLLYILSR